jgi:hypothetical protein
LLVREAVTDDTLAQSIYKAQKSLGIIPINEDNECIWGCVDIDSYAGFDHQKINQIK